MYTPTSSKSNGYRKFFLKIADDGYLTISNGNFNADNVSASITRGEAVYLLVNNLDWLTGDKSIETVYSELNGEYKLSDVKNGGDMLSYYNGAKGAELATLATMLKSPSGGIDDGMYQALAIAQANGIIESETRWDEALSRSEAIEMLVNALEKAPRLTSVENGKVDASKWVDDSIGESIQNPAQIVDRYTLADLTKTQLGYFESIVELEKPVEYIQAMALSGKYSFDTDELKFDNHGYDEESGKYSLRRLATDYIDLDVVSSLRTPVKEYITLELIPSNGIDLFREWFKKQPEYAECLKAIDDAYAAYEASLNAPETTRAPETTAAPETTRAPETTAAPVPLNQPKYLLYDVKARTSPAENSAYNGVMPCGALVTLLYIDKTTNWCTCTYNGAQVYILGKYLSDTKPNVQNNTGSYASTEGMKTPNGLTLGRYGYDQGYDPNTGYFRAKKPGDYGYEGLVAATYIASGTLYNDKRTDNDYTYGTHIKDTLATLKSVLPTDEYNKLAADVEYCFTVEWARKCIGTYVSDILSIAALPDGSYATTLGQPGQVIYTDPEYPFCYIGYDYSGVLCSIVNFPSDHPTNANKFLKSQIVNTTYTDPREMMKDQLFMDLTDKTTGERAVLNCDVEFLTPPYFFDQSFPKFDTTSRIKSHTETTTEDIMREIMAELGIE